MNVNFPDVIRKSGVMNIRTVECHRVISSTNDRVKEIISRPMPPETPILVLAEEQTAGRGRGGKGWWAARGAMLLSLGLDLSRHGLSSRDLTLLSPATALALRELLGKQYLESRRVEIHWPNDVYVDGAKIGGILIESPHPKYVVIGVGANVNNSVVHIPKALDDEFACRRITSLIDLNGGETNLLSFVLGFLTCFERKLEQMAGTPTLVVEEMKCSCIQMGRLVRFRIGEKNIEGRCRGIGMDGSLQLETENGLKIELLTGTIENKIAN